MDSGPISSDSPKSSRFEIRPPRDDEFAQIVALADLGFGEETSPEWEEELRNDFPWERALCAYDAGRVVGSLAAYTMELTLPGGATLPTSGITWGGTLPTHRRRGILADLLAGLLDDGVRRDEPLSVLMASESRIYPRFGFGPATTMMSFSLDRAHAGFSIPMPTAAPQAITLLSNAEATDRLPQIYESARRDQPGAVTRSATWWSHYLADPLPLREGATKMYHAVHEDDAGREDGYVTYRLKEDWAVATPVYEVRVEEVIAGTAECYKALWDYVIGTDLVQTISCHRGRPDEPLRLLLADSRRLEVNAIADDLYLRLLDIPRALAARTYAATGDVVLEVADSFPAPTTSRYALAAEAGRPGATCTATRRPADIILRTDALAAAYLGGETFTNLVRAGRATASNPAGLVAADAMFSWGIAPYCCTMF
jgi:predicted acetyltransferase